MELPDALNFLLKNKRDDLSVRQLAILIRIAAEPGTIRGMAADMGTSKPAITRGVDRLADLGFAKRKVDLNDRRSVIVSATGSGRQLAVHLTHAPTKDVALHG